jgi:hypothetical protein
MLGRFDVRCELGVRSTHIHTYGGAHPERAHLANILFQKSYILIYDSTGRNRLPSDSLDLFCTRRSRYERERKLGE